jgi:hypothetical protein
MRRHHTIFGHLTVWFFLVIFPTAAEAKVARITLKKLVDSSDLIVVACETNVEDGPAELNFGEEVRSPITVATARIVEILKGKAGPEVRYIASPTWTCDISKAKAGERVVLFLSKSKHAPFMFIAHSGRGRMPIRDVNGKQHATIWVGDVQLPRGVPTVPGPNPEYSFIRSVDVNELKGAVHRALGFDAMAIALGVMVALVAPIIVMLPLIPLKQTRRPANAA